MNLFSSKAHVPAQQNRLEKSEVSTNVCQAASANAFKKKAASANNHRKISTSNCA
jgi:hypothetical protein